MAAGPSFLLKEAAAVLGLPALGNWQQQSGELPEPQGSPNC